ncbi:MAG: c-type cytochrome [Planctomycetaceae bacterium]|nr:c-type cytochrome [Planctomycetaceae bacterium]
MRCCALGWWQAAAVSLVAATLAWFATNLLSARIDSAPSVEMTQAGHELFVHQWAAQDPKAHGDGLGPVFNANSCVACHFQGGVGGGGDVNHNVTAYEVHPTIRDPDLQHGLVHAFAVNASFVESRLLVKQCFPVIPGGDRVVGGCTVRIEDFDPVRIEVTNSIALFGDGLIDRVGESSIRLNHARRMMGQIGREIGGDFTTAGAGRPRVLADGRLGKFGWKAQFATLEEFVAAACANELGLGNPLMEQAKPLGKDYGDSEADLTGDQFRQLVSFVDALPRPVEVLPTDSRERALAERGKMLFQSVGCAQCHTPDIGNVAGIHSDLLLHSVTSRAGDGYRHEILVEVPPPGGHPKHDEWRTPPLWGVADSAPYFHDGAAPTLKDAILRHDGEAAPVTKAFSHLPPEEQAALIAFLQTLQAPPDALPAEELLAASAVAANE